MLIILSPRIHVLSHTHTHTHTRTDTHKHTHTQMKEKPGLREIASLLQRELSDRFQKVLVPTSFNFDPVYFAATVLAPQYRILLNEEQQKHAKAHIIRELMIVLATSKLAYLPVRDQLSRLLFGFHFYQPERA